MLGFKKKGGPPRPYTHAPDCKILTLDPSFEAPWQEIETGLWGAECQCGKEVLARATYRRSRSARPA
ncbi:MAG: hypothetical protein K0R20_2449 [Actinomycetia bacterium]|jgi:hypothetical protein|nr:hypothetical protein [Actinomycetes bacterium]